MNFISDLENQEKENETLAHRFHMDIFQKGDLLVADKILATNFVWRNPAVPSELAHGPEGTKKVASAVIDSIPDCKITHDDIMSKGDKVMIRWTMVGTIKKEIFGLQPSERTATIIGFDLFRISNHKIVEMWQQFSPGTWS